MVSTAPGQDSSPAPRSCPPDPLQLLFSYKNPNQGISKKFHSIRECPGSEVHPQCLQPHNRGTGRFPRSPVVRTLNVHCGGHGFDPWPITKIPHATRCGKINKNKALGTFLVVQWQEICLPTQGTQVDPLSGKNPCAME